LVRAGVEGDHRAVRSNREAAEIGALWISSSLTP
jgi:hypothetical protein